MTDDSLQRVIDDLDGAISLGRTIATDELKNIRQRLAALSAQTEARDGVEEYEVWQDGMMQAGASGEGALQEAKHYAMVYGHQSAPVTIYKIIRKEIAQGDL